MDKKNLKKPLLLTLSILSLGSIVGGYFIYDRNFRNKQEAPNFEADLTQSPNFQVKYVYNQDGARFGSYEINYKVTPEIYTDQIVVSAMYADNSALPTDIIGLSHFPAEKKLVVLCKQVFKKQVLVKLFARSNADVNCTIKFDFREKLEVGLPDNVTLSEGETPKVNVDIRSTGGSKEADKTVKNETYTWNKEYLTWCQNVAIEYFDDLIDREKINCDIRNAGLGESFGLTQLDCSNLFKNTFSITQFLRSTGFNYSFEYRYSDDDDPSYTRVDAKLYLNDISYDKFQAEFNGEAKIIDYTCMVDGQKYSKSLGIQLDKIPVTKITADISEYVF